ncbi:hypothetical protein [Aestuariispira ectoiniformans]|uniref:hypothetical protein n=1 Tax=Aestuariispira ectoiniformans TaxID=2775080 RepID=UPI00223BE864|nr:hypothetical protein [Aestuariispira ectoiniformans]
MRSTEDVQRAILTYLHGHREATMATIIAHMFPEENEGTILPEVLQAAQILVNRRQLTAWRGAATVDPVHAGAETLLRLS